VFIAAFLVHVAFKFGRMRDGLRIRAEVLEASQLQVGDRVTIGPAPPLATPNPAPATMSRRALLAGAGGASALLLLQGAGQSIGGPLRFLAFLLPRGRTRSGPNGFLVNKSWAAAGVPGHSVGSGWRLHLHGVHSLSLTREQLMALPQHSYELPIACVEGWSTTQRWTGVRLRDLAALCGIDRPASVTSVSLERGTYGRATLGHEQVADPRSLLALCVNGVNLSLDHGFPARVIAPAVPGVHCTKWVSEMSFAPLRT
jgi:DMSO/TMAO reductase YedYZ molybdopterin-dependent catalytic subunit